MLSAQVTNGPCGDADDDADPEAEFGAWEDELPEEPLSCLPHALKAIAPATPDADAKATLRVIVNDLILLLYLGQLMY